MLELRLPGGQWWPRRPPARRGQTGELRPVPASPPPKPSGTQAWHWNPGSGGVRPPRETLRVLYELGSAAQRRELRRGWGDCGGAPSLCSGRGGRASSVSTDQPPMPAALLTWFQDPGPTVRAPGFGESGCSQDEPEPAATRAALRGREASSSFRVPVGRSRPGLPRRDPRTAVLGVTLPN